MVMVKYLFFKKLKLNIKMINFDKYVNENKTNYKNWPYIPDHPNRILIIVGSGSGKNKFIFKFNRKSTRHW